MVLLGSKIKELRKKSKLTQTELASKVGVTKSTIAAYENNSRQPSYDVLIKMADVFKVSTDFLLLDKTNLLVEVEGLDAHQLEFVNILITYFQKGNMVDGFFKDCPPELKEKLKNYVDIKTKDRNKEN